MSIQSLNQISTGTSAKICGTSDSGTRLSFLLLGLLPGDEIVVRHKAPMGGPIAVEANGTLIAIRLEDAMKIEVEVIR